LPSDSLISQTATGGTQTSFLSDGPGSTAALTDSAGAVTGTYQFDVFGAVCASTGTASSDYRFSGQQQEVSSGLTYLRARFYDPAIGRFLSKDPFPGVAGLPLSQNAYTYAQSVPTQYTDPSGLCFWDLCIGEIALGIATLSVADIAFAGAVALGVTATIANICTVLEANKTDRLKQHVTPKDIRGAQRDIAGNPVPGSPDGDDWQHEKEVREAQRGLVKRVEAIKKRLNDTRLGPAERDELTAELGEASRLLDWTEKFVPR
jgi:RHS repeat-associated protein